MRLIQVFDPAPCCSSSACGSADSALAAFAGDVQWATRNGARIERANIVEQPAVFAENATVMRLLDRSGAEALPVVLVEGDVAMAGRYPSRDELARWAGIGPAATEDAGNCCSGGRCCG